MEQTFNELLRTVTEDYLAGIDMDSIPSPSTIENELLQATNNAIEAWNMGPRDPSAPVGAPLKDAYPDQKPPGERIRKFRTLSNWQVAAIITRLHGACRIATAGENSDKDYDIVAMYQTEGDNRGIYVTSEDDFRRVARSYNLSISTKDFTEVMVAIRDLAPRKGLTMDPDLVAVNNGVYDYANKFLLGFDPEFVFLSKSHVDFVDNAKNPVIHNDDDDTDWDVVSWMDELSDDKEIVQLLWEILGAIIRPNVSWNKSAWLYSENGNNGKGTLCTLMRNLCGAGAYASIKLKDFGQDFMLEPLTRASAIIVDENDVGTYIDQAANLKAVITNDVISINRKFKTPIAYRFHGFMVQCMNEFPKVKDRSDSFYRRQLFIPMEKRFEGVERKYIKNDYLYRKEVLEYVLFHVLAETNYYSLSEPEACRKVLEDYKEFNDPVRQFFMELEENASWDLLPYKFIYDLYRHWFQQNMPSGKPLGRNGFLKELRVLASTSDVFYIPDGDATVRSDGRMDYPEPLILEYGVTEWMNQQYRGSDTGRMCMPDLNEKYRGLLRYDTVPAPDTDPSAGHVPMTPDSVPSDHHTDKEETDT